MRIKIKKIKKTYKIKINKLIISYLKLWEKDRLQI